MNKLRLILIAIAVVIAAALFFADSGDRRSKSARPQKAGQITENRSNRTEVLLSTITMILNNLPDEAVLELAPPRPLLDDAKSADGKPVLATCNVTPEVPDGPFNYINVPKKNANFTGIGVRAGDIVRYFVTSDQDAQSLGIDQRTYLELPVRRLDANDPQNALIVEGGLNGPVLFPERIEIWRFSDRRMNEIRQSLNRYIQRPRLTVGWEPSPDAGALDQLLDRLNQWLRNSQKPAKNWQPDPRLAELPTDIKTDKSLKQLLSPENISNGQFQAHEIRDLQQAIWLRDISRWVAGKTYDEMTIANALFDWTIRNIQLENSDAKGIVQRPWQALLYGSGSAEQRAWIFAELCRQQQLDVVILKFGNSENPNRPWLAALMLDGKFYLFDLQLGLPIPGNETDQIATLSAVIANPEMLRKLDLGEEMQYPITADMLSEVEVQLITTPMQMSRRANLLQQSLEGDDYITLTSENDRLGKEIVENPNVKNVQLWPFPFTSMIAERKLPKPIRLQAAQRFLVFAQRPRLWKARTLHFQGTKPIPIDQRNDPLALPEEGHKEAMELYRDKGVRIPNAQLEVLEPAKQVIYRRAKSDASYWVGLLSYDRGLYEVAIQWFKDRTLDALPDGPWTAGAQYNLARAHEALGNYDEAIQLLEADDSLQRHGNLLRAQRLRLTQDSNKTDDTEETEEVQPAEATTE